MLDNRRKTWKRGYLSVNGCFLGKEGGVERFGRMDGVTDMIPEGIVRYFGICEC